MVVFSQTNSVTPVFYSIYLRKIRLYMIYSNLKNFSLFNFEIFRLIHCYSKILGVSLEPCRRSICLLFQISFVVIAIFLLGVISNSAKFQQIFITASFSMESP